MTISATSSAQKDAADLTLKPQEVPFDHPQSTCFFQPSSVKPFVATSAALASFGEVTIVRNLRRLQALAKEQRGIDYLQVFLHPSDGRELWFIEDGQGGAITALLPTDY